MPVLDQVQDDGSGIQNILKLLDSGLRRNDVWREFQTFYGIIKFSFLNFGGAKRLINSALRTLDHSELFGSHAATP